MAVQKPLVLVGGNILQLPTVDVLAKADVGLGNVDNTSDTNKPISTNQQTALNLKQDTLVSGTNIKTIGGASVLGSGDLAVIGGLVTTPIKTANYTAVVNDLVRVDSTAGAFTVTLPASPVDGDKVGLFDIANKCATYAVLITVAGGKTIEGDATGLSVNVNGAYVYLIYNSTGTNWKIAETTSSPSVTVFREVQTATASQTVFTVGTAYAPNTSALNVYIDGVRQFPSAYAETDSTTVTFTTGLTVGAKVLFESNTTTYGAVNTASSVSFNPVGGIAAGSVQAAIAELDSEKAMIASVPVAANPTGTIAGSAVNGSATTFMRSDAAPTLSLTLAQLNTAVSDADLATLGTNTFTGQQTFAETMDTVYGITDGVAFEIDPANGNIQTITLGAARTPAATNFAAGQCILLGIDDGIGYAITWSSVAVTWVKVGGTGVAPTLATTGYTWILLWKVATTIYGCEVGKP